MLSFDLSSTVRQLQRSSFHLHAAHHPFQYMRLSRGSVCGYCGCEDLGDRSIVDGDVDWIHCTGHAHGPGGQWYHGVCQMLYSKRDYDEFVLCHSCQPQRSAICSTGPTARSQSKCSPRCKGCSRSCDEGMDYWTRDQRAVLWDLVVRADALERTRPAAALGEAVRVTQDSGPAKRASVLHWTSEKAAVVYAGSSEPSLVESSKVIRYPLKSANITSRIPAIAEHVGAPYGSLQVQHEVSCMRDMLLRRRSSEPLLSCPL